MRRKTLAAIFVLALALLLRVPFIDTYPTGFTPDEASFGYDAYSLLKTGKDQWGEAWPLTFRSFGDSKLPLYTYLTIPSVALLGLNEFAVRLPNAILGGLAVFATFFMVLELFKNWRLGKLNNYHLAFLSSLLLAISPWHIALSRGAFEANLTVLFMSAGVLFFLKGLTNHKLLLYSSIAFGLSVFSYHSARLVAPLIAFFLIWFKLPEIKTVEKKFLKLSSFILGLFLAVAFLQFVTQGSSRAADITIFNPTDEWASVFERRVAATLDGLPDSVSRAFNNKVLYVIDRFFNNYITYFSPQYLFTLGPSEWTYGMIAGRGVLYVFEMLFVAAALWYLIRGKGKGTFGVKLVLFWLLVAAVPAALTKGAGYAGNRSAVMMPAVQIFSALGGLIVYQLVSKRIGKNLSFALFSGVILLSLIFFLEDYKYHAPRNGAGAMLYGRKEAIDFAKEKEDEYEQIIVSRTLSEPQIFVAFYTQYDPVEYQDHTVDWLRFEEEGLSFLDQLGEYGLGKYTFKNINFATDSKVPNALLIGKPGEFPFEVKATKTIEYKNRKPAIIIFDTRSQGFAQTQ